MFIGTILVVASLAAPLPGTAALSPSITAQNAQAAEPAAMICPVTGKSIEPGQGTRVTVRGRDYTVFDAAAATELKANPDQYLEADGTPKNAKK